MRGHLWNEIEKFKQQYKCHKSIRMYIGCYAIQISIKRAKNGHEYFYVSTNGTDTIFININKSIGYSSIKKLTNTYFKHLIDKKKEIDKRMTKFLSDNTESLDEYIKLTKKYNLLTKADLKWLEQENKS